jgi:hypothetical protein
VPIPASLARSAASPEHTAQLLPAEGFDFLSRKDDFLDDGVHCIFGIKNDKAELQAIHFQASRFTPEMARAWLRELELEPVQFTSAGQGENAEASVVRQ